MRTTRGRRTAWVTWSLAGTVGLLAGAALLDGAASSGRGTVRAADTPRIVPATKTAVPAPAAKNAPSAKKKFAPRFGRPATTARPATTVGKVSPSVKRPPAADGTGDAARTAADVDRLLHAGFEAAGTPVAPRANDEDFLRRISLDLAGRLPSPREITLFGLDGAPDKRVQAIDRLVEDPAFAENWARYWRDVLFLRATNERSQVAAGTFEKWIAEQFRAKTSWDRIATELVTSTGDVQEDGSTALVFAHMGDAQELASETSRIFLGIQIQCANCHDHPTDKWKRADFHGLAAFFPRIRLQPKMDGAMRSFEVVSLDETPGGGRFGLGDLQENADRMFARNDANRDGKLTAKEVEGAPIAQLFGRLLQLGDSNKDGALSLEEIRKIPAPMMQGRGSVEYHMPDLSDPSSRGTVVSPKFFVDGHGLAQGASDMDRRRDLARALVAPENPWFARAFVNRLWAELLGEGFYAPVDDLGPEREARFPDVLDRLAAGFVASGHDVRWLLRTIARTDAYQRAIRPADPSGAELPFAAQRPTRLRSDQIYDSLAAIFGTDAVGAPAAGGPGPQRFLARGPRQAFNALFGYDPSTPQDEIRGTVPQALFLMNSPQLAAQIEGSVGSRVGQLLSSYKDDRDALAELYLLVLSREPSAKEEQIGLAHVKEVGARQAAFEDLLWALLNSTEFLTKR